MGIADRFGFGKKEKTPFKIPAEVLALRTRVEAENRENYPNLARYQEIVNIARAAYKKLDVLIAQEEHAEEAVRIKEDIKKKMGQLTEKVNKNKEAAKKEGNEDYVASDLEYLERKGMRNQAKSLFTECLESIEAMMKCCQGERSHNGAPIESATGEFIKALSALQNDYFKKYGDDKEIKNIREELLKKIDGLNNYFEMNKDRIREQGLEEKARSVLAEIAKAARRLSEI
jgi:hypothetical protein